MIEPTDEIARFPNDATIAIDWNPTFMDMFFNMKELEVGVLRYSVQVVLDLTLNCTLCSLYCTQDVWSHDTVAAHRSILSQSVSFADCMSEFTRAEVLDKDSRCDHSVFIVVVSSQLIQLLCV